MAKNPIKYNGPAKVDSDGVLAQCVRQPCDNSPTLNEYVEKWKGPYKLLKDVPARIALTDTAYTVEKVHTKLGANYLQRFEIPDCPNVNGNKAEWILNSCSVQQLEAGDHAIITFNFKNTSSFDSGSPSSGITDNSQDLWTVSWQSYTVTPYAFCANASVNLTSYIVSPGNGKPDDPHWDIKTSRSGLETALNSPQWTIINDCIVYTPDLNTPDVKYYLPAAFTKIWEKIALQRNAVYHTPLVTHQTAMKFNNSALSSTTSTDAQPVSIKATPHWELGEDLDTITTLPATCPYSFAQVMTGEGPKGWDWIKIGDDVTTSNNLQDCSTSYIRKETWAGYPAGTIDENYYGIQPMSHDKAGLEKTRWQFHGV